MLQYISYIFLQSNYKTADKNVSNITAPKIPPIIGPTTGTQAYFQFESPLPFIGSIACAILGPKSLAGLIAYPVAPLCCHTYYNN